MSDLQLVKAIEEFYNSAWEKLLITAGTLTAALLFVSGFVVPYYFAKWQRRVNSEQEEKLKQDYRFELSQVVEELRKEIENRLNSISTNMNEAAAHNEKLASGMSFHVQGVALADK